jgi:hypothetical protein
MRVGDSLSFRSPLRKLLRFFHRSRDQWKEKCKEAKRQNKSLRICLAKMKEKRDRWKTRAMELEEELKRETPGIELSPAWGGICPR